MCLNYRYELKRNQNNRDLYSAIYIFVIDSFASIDLDTQAPIRYGLQNQLR